MGFKNYCLKRIKTDIKRDIILTILIFVCLFSTVYFSVNGFARNSLMALSGVLFIPIIFLLEYYLKIDFVSGFLTLVVILIIGGMQLGPSYDFYIKIPIFDDIIHCLSGFIFTFFGIGLSKRIIKNDNFIVHVMIGILFSLSIALLWEMFEFVGTYVFGFDMQEDKIIYDIKSYLLAGSHNDIFLIENINKTIIYYGDGQQVTINGYLDIGVFDTLFDMFICLAGTIIGSVIALVSKYRKDKICKIFIPQDNKYLLK